MFPRPRHVPPRLPSQPRRGQEVPSPGTHSCQPKCLKVRQTSYLHLALQVNQKQLMTMAGGATGTPGRRPCRGRQAVRPGRAERKQRERRKRWLQHQQLTDSPCSPRPPPRLVTFVTVTCVLCARHDPPAASVSNMILPEAGLLWTSPVRSQPQMPSPMINIHRC